VWRKSNNLEVGVRGFCVSVNLLYRDNADNGRSELCKRGKIGGFFS